MDAKQLPLGIRLRDTSVFASYFAGRNRSVVDALHAMKLRTPPAPAGVDFSKLKIV